jgi:hypothetical protein
MKHPPHNSNIIVCIIVSVFALVTTGYCASFNLAPDGQRSAALEIITESPDEIILEFSFGDIVVDSLEDQGQYWKTARIENCGMMSAPGKPELPSFSKWLRVPWSNPQVEVIESEHVSRNWGKVLPVQEVMYRSAADSPKRIPDRTIYDRNRIFPDQVAAVDVSGEIGNSSVALVTVTPVQVNARSGEWITHTRIRLSITGSRRGNLDDATRIESPSAKELMDALTRSPGHSALDEFSDQPRMLLVTPLEFASALEPFVEWKNRSGVPVETIIYSEVASDAEELRSYLISRIEDTQPPPEFLLLIGDIDAIPAFFGVGSSLTDHPYSTLIGNDFLPDISVGRISIDTPPELAEWITRLLNYERDGIVPEQLNATSFSSTAALDPQHGIDVTALFGSSGYSVTHLQQPQTGTLQALENSLNQNPAWVFYIGHGHAHAWSSVGPPFQMSDVPDIDSSSSSIVVSVACATADLDFPGESISEEWFNQSLNGGLLAYFGATESTAFFYSDTIGIAALRGVFSQEIERLGIAADYGRLMCAESFPQLPGGLTEETIQQFILLGDPSMRVFTQTPQIMTVTHANSLPVGSSTLPVTVSIGGQPVNGAEICLQGTDVYSVARTGLSGSAELTFILDHPEALQLTVTARNAVAYLRDVQIVPNNAPYVIVDHIAVLDEAGDNDHRADRAESCSLQLTLRNIGSLPSTPGELTIFPSEETIQLAVTELSIPSIAASDTLTLTQTVGATVAGDAEDGAAVMLDIEISESTGANTISLQSLELHAPVILYRRSELSELAGDNDGSPEAGEMLALDLFFTNVGSDRALPLAIDFHTSPSYLQIHDTRVVSDTLSEGEDYTARFVFDANLNTPRGYPFEFYYELTSANVDSQTQWDAQRVGQVPVLLYELDQSPDQIDAIQDALASLGIEYERTTQLPLNLFRYRSVWIFCGVSPNARPLPQQDASRLAEYLQGGGRCYWEGADVWSFDQQTALHPYFHIIGASDGSSNAGPVSGEYGTEYQEYSFEYSGENSFIDQLEADGGATVILRNARDGHTYPVCIAYAGDSYRTIGSSIEIGMLDDSNYPSTRVHLIAKLLDWLGIESRVDIYPPAIQHAPLTGFHQRNVPIPVVADIQDASGVGSARIRYRINEQAELLTDMNQMDGLYRGAIPGVPFGTMIHYRIEATDQAAAPNTILTDEFSFRVSSDAYDQIDLTPDNFTYRTIKPRVKAPENASWSLTKNEEGRQVIELHGTSSEDPISYTTGIIDCSQFENVRLTFWNYLRTGDEDQGAVARVSGSRDGGQTFPYVVWRRVQESAPVLEQGQVTSDVLDWMSGYERVALRFETTTGWYWRIGELQLFGDTRAELTPVSELTIHPNQGGITLFWRPTEQALTYQVFTSSVDGEDQYQLYSELRDTSFVDLESYTLPQRFYRVYALMREGRMYQGSDPQVTIDRANLGAPDIRWNIRKIQSNR